MKVLHVVPNINRDVGGPAYSVSRMASEQGRAGMDVALATLDYQRHGPMMPLDNCQLAATRGPWFTRITRGMNGAHKRTISSLAADCAVIHNHGLWMHSNRYARQAADRYSIPLVISPRGMLDEWARSFHAPKKKIAWMLFEHENLRHARLFHATSMAELDSIRSVGLTAPVAVIPNGIDLPDLDAIVPRSQIEDKFPELRGKRWLLFLSRLHEKKGLDTLFDAWDELADQFPDWVLVVTGPMEESGRRLVEAMRRSNTANFATVITGALFGVEKSCLLHHSEIFALPTRSENFGNVIGESLAHGTPVVTTRAAPWPMLEEDKCGWWIEQRLDCLTGALSSALAISDEQRSDMGMRGRRWVDKNLSWQALAAEMVDVYQWLSSAAPQPDTVHE